MGKKLKMQRRGKGSNAYTKLPGTYDLNVNYKNTKTQIIGTVTNLFNHTGHSGVLMEVVYDDFSKDCLLAPEGIKINDKIYINKNIFSLGSVLKLSDIPEGIPIYNIELRPGDGGKYVRSGGSAAYIIMHSDNETKLVLPSKATISLSNQCRAQLGVVSNGGRTDQVLVKAGKNFYIKHATNKLWPTYRGVKSNPVDHPFGGKQHHKGKGSMTSRNAPPGRKVGHIAARRTGRRKK
ncbi:MAG: 50S ribosomal protein L2 [Candidatus Marsarchaeota archaeon]|nr:50S ribosomal protein L2 [Candidatus Marsarchaeota archaeon]MCL5094818.1 50S ribosomal protein L2 [Candidatus Marsarchaeota archaeon]